VIAAHNNPQELVYLDDALDAAIMCTVGRRASVAQGRALLSVWDRSFHSALSTGAFIADSVAINTFSNLLRSASSKTPAVAHDLPSVSVHLPPLFGVVAKTLGLSLQQTAYVFILSHVKALLSAAVRASIFGPYQAQKLLASRLVQDSINEAIAKEWNTKVEDAGQCIPVMDLWVGRHEILYSRIFNS
jgi:urease accessory protein